VKKKKKRLEVGVGSLVFGLPCGLSAMFIIYIDPAMMVKFMMLGWIIGLGVFLVGRR